MKDKIYEIRNDCSKIEDCLKYSEMTLDSDTLRCYKCPVPKKVK